MGCEPLKRDRLMSAIFGQMDILQEMAIAADDIELSQDLSAALAKALDRYCNAKRESLATRLKGIDPCKRHA